MPNDKDTNLSPQEDSEEKNYSFLRETIKPKPISREQLLRQFVRTAVYGIILGVFACLGFFALKPWAQNWFQGNPKTVTIPEDEDPDAENAAEGEEAEETTQELDAESYDQIMAGMDEIADEAGKCVVSVEAVPETEDWNAEMTGIGRNAAGLITADNGQEILILADSRICQDAASWKVVFDDGRQYSAVLKKKDGNSGLAVFSVERRAISDATWSSISVAVLGNSNLVDQGEPVISLGNMFGYGGGMAYGFVSSTDYRHILYDGECDVISTDIAVESAGTGFLFNISGEVIGMITPSVWDGTGDNIANAYSISDLKPLIEILLNGGSVPYTGIHGTMVTSELEKEKGIPQGMYVVDVETDSPAMAAGIQSGDVICSVGGEKITNIGGYQDAVLNIKVGDQVIIEGKRLGADGYVNVDFTVTVGSIE